MNPEPPQPTSKPTPQPPPTQPDQASAGITTLPMLLIGLIGIAIIIGGGVFLYGQSNSSEHSASEPVTSNEPKAGTAPVTAQPTLIDDEAANRSLSRKATTPTPSALSVAQTGQRAVHQKVLKEFISCIKNKGENCICQHWDKKYCKSTTSGSNANNVDLWYILIPSHFQRESDSDLLEDITDPSFGPSDGTPFVQYRLRTSEEQTNEVSFVYEDGAWKLHGID